MSLIVLKPSRSIQDERAHRLPQAVLEAGTVGEAGERVGLRPQAHLIEPVPLRGDVLLQSVEPQGPTVSAFDRGGDANPARPATGRCDLGVEAESVGFGERPVAQSRQLPPRGVGIEGEGVRPLDRGAVGQSEQIVDAVAPSQPLVRQAAGPHSHAGGPHRRFEGGLDLFQDCPLRADDGGLDAQLHPQALDLGSRGLRREGRWKPIVGRANRVTSCRGTEHHPAGTSLSAR